MARLIWTAVGALLFAFPPTSSTFAQSELDIRQSYIYGTPDQPTDAWRLAYGGRLYDTWWVVLEMEPPTERHPAYPRSGTAIAATTWRCVACHGWDYKGSAGATVAVPLMPGVAGRNPALIKRVVRDRRHRYSESMIPDVALDRLALFLASGLPDIARYIDPDTNEIHGDEQHGRAVYQNVCAACHNFSGNAAIYGEDDNLRTLGAIANANPWQALHKIRNGQPGADMLAMRVFDEAVVADVIAHLTTLPVGGAE